MVRIQNPSALTGVLYVFESAVKLPAILLTLQILSKQFVCDSFRVYSALTSFVCPFPFQKLSLSPQQTQGSSVSSPHASQPSQEESSLCSDMSSCEEPPSPLSAASSGALAPPPAPSQVPVHRHPSRASDLEGCSERDASLLRQRFLPNDPTKWNVEEVYDFIRSLPGQMRRHTHLLLHLTECNTLQGNKQIRFKMKNRCSFVLVIREVTGPLYTHV